MNEQNNIQVVQKAYECFGKGDIPGILATLSADVVWHVAPVENVPYTGTRNGHEGAASFFTGMVEAEDTLKFEPREFTAQDDRVIVIGHYEARAKATGREYATYWVHVFKFRDGKITSFAEYTDTAAIAAAFVKAQNA